MFVTVFAWSGFAIAQTENTTTDAVTETQKEGLLNRIRAVMPGQVERMEDKKEVIENRANERVGNMEERRDSMETRRAEAVERREMVREEIQQRIESRKLEIEERKEERMERKIDVRFERLVSNLEATIARLESLGEKLGSRIEKVKAVGGNTIEAERLFIEGEMHLDEAKTALSVMETLVVNTDESVTEETMEAVKTASQEVHKHLRNAHQSLMKIVGSLRGVSQLQETNASTTSE